jgi:tetratricopeptide (TPR) repeat protein
MKTDTGGLPRIRALRLIGLGLGFVLAAAALTGAGAIWMVRSRPDPEEVWKEAEADIRAERWESARAGLRRLERLRKATGEDWLLRAQIATAAGDDAAGLEALSHVPEDHPLYPQSLYMAGLIERRHLRLRYAEAAYRKALACDPGLVSAHKELIYILGMQSRRRELDAEFRALSRVAPLTHRDLFTWGLTHFVQWGPDSAEQLQSFIEADPEDRFSRLSLAGLLIDQPGERERVEWALKTLPADDPEALAMRIELRLNHGEVEEAMGMLDRTKESNPALERLRGRASLMRGDAAGAIRHFQAALSDEPYDRVSIGELGKALLLRGDRAGAARYLARAKQLDEVYNLINRVSKSERENQPADVMRIARACEAAGLVDEARGWFMLAIGRNPLDSEAQQGLHRLRSSSAEEKAVRP